MNVCHTFACSLVRFLLIPRLIGIYSIEQEGKQRPERFGVSTCRRSGWRLLFSLLLPPHWSVAVQFHSSFLSFRQIFPFVSVEFDLETAVTSSLYMLYIIRIRKILLCI